MKRYLLFDSGCSTCSEIAHDIESEAAGWLKIRSLRESQVQEWLNDISPGWRWQPTLLVDTGSQKHIYTGVALATHLISGIGLSKSVTIFTKVADYKPNVPYDPQRRSFLKQAIGVFGGLAVAR